MTKITIYIIRKIMLYMDSLYNDIIDIMKKIDKKNNTFKIIYFYIRLKYITLICKICISIVQFILYLTFERVNYYAQKEMIDISVNCLKNADATLRYISSETDEELSENE